MTAADWVPIVQAVIAAIGVALTTLASFYIPIAIRSFEARTHIALTDQERAAIERAITTAAGLVQNRLDVGLLKARDITPSNPIVVAETERAMAAVPDAVAAQGTSLLNAAAAVAARVDVGPKPAVAAVAAIAPSVIPAPVTGPRVVS